MGGNSSKPVQACADPVDCEPQVAYVKRECEKAGNGALQDTLQRVIFSIAGPTYGNQILNAYNPSLGNIQQYKWNNIQPDVILGFKNYEGFKEGVSNNDCVECSCSAAAEKIIAECKKVNPLVPDAVMSTINNGVPLMGANAQQAMKLAPAAPIEPPSKWDSVYNPGLFDNKETFINNNNNTNNTNNTNNNKETFDNNDNNKIYKFIKDAIQERHTKFKNTASFSQDCRRSSYYSMNKFITEEKVMLDKLFAYYTNFVSSYESLFLHKEATLRIINGKLDELEKIQSKIDSYKTNLHVDNRKNNYQNNNYTFYITVKKYMLILYYSLFIVYLIFSNFLSEKQYTNKKILLILVIYLLIPIILSYAINIIYEGYIYFLEYYNLKEDTKSYADIIKA